MTILTHLDKLSSQAADRYTFYRESNHALAVKFGEIGVRLWHKRMKRFNEDMQEVIKSMEEKILNDKVVITAIDPKDLWDSGLAMWLCHTTR